MTEEEIAELKEEEKEEEETEQGGQAGQWIFGLVLIAVGLFFLLSNVVDLDIFSNWWALFILFPAAVSLNNAWQSYRRHGRLTRKGRGALIGGLLIGAVGLILLLGLNFGTMWPVFIIIVGIGALLNGLWS